MAWPQAIRTPNGAILKAANISFDTYFAAALQSIQDPNKWWETVIGGAYLCPFGLNGVLVSEKDSVVLGMFLSRSLHRFIDQWVPCLAENPQPIPRLPDFSGEPQIAISSGEINWRPGLQGLCNNSNKNLGGETSFRCVGILKPLKLLGKISWIPNLMSVRASFFRWGGLVVSSTTCPSPQLEVEHNFLKRWVGWW